jgi:hypothetical protein
MEKNPEKKIEVEIERNKIRLSIFHGEDEQIIKLTLKEAQILTGELAEAIKGYPERKQVRID